MSSRTKALIAILLAAFFWSTAGLAKIVVRNLDPYIVAFLRFFIASLIILPFFLKENIKRKHMIRDLVPLSLASTGNVVLYYLGLQTSTANAATLIYAGVPLVTALIAHRLIKERLTKRKIIGITTGLIGVILVAILPALERGESISGDLKGNIFFLLAVVIWSLYTIGSRRAISVQGYSPIVVSSISIFTTCVVLFPISLLTFQPSYLTTLQQPSTMLLIAHLGVLVTVATYVLYQWGIKHSSATAASLIMYIGPVFSIAINMVVLGEPVTPPFIIGTVFVFLGLLITSGKGLMEEMQVLVKRVRK